MRNTKSAIILKVRMCARLGGQEGMVMAGMGSDRAKDPVV